MRPCALVADGASLTPLTGVDNTALETNPVPAELRGVRQWVTWKYVLKEGAIKPTKVPFNPLTGLAAGSTSAATWASYDEAVTAAKNRAHDGVGFVFTATDPYVGVDLDDCMGENGELVPWAANIVKDLRSYTERSPSGNGVHIIARGNALLGGRKKGPLEMYSKGRYFTVTGNPWGGAPRSIEDRHEELERLYAASFGAKKVKNSELPQAASTR